MLWSNIRPQTSKLYVTGKYIKYHFRPSKHIGQALPFWGLTFPLWSPIKEMFHFQSLPLHVSRSPQYRSCPSRFLSQMLYKERDAAFPKHSVTCLTYLAEFPLKQSSFHVLLTELSKRETHCFQSTLLLSLKVPGKWTPPPGSPHILRMWKWSVSSLCYKWSVSSLCATNI